jgi:hypothetical protein
MLGRNGLVRLEILGRLGIGREEEDGAGLGFCCSIEYFGSS